nr:tyrosine-type recombinase/integrase [Mycobacterium heidelbergense]
MPSIGSCHPRSSSQQTRLNLFSSESTASAPTLPGCPSGPAPSLSALRDPNNFGKQWRTVREELGVPEVTTHSFRKTVATLIDEDGLSARIGADHLGHSHVSMTQDRYMTRGRIHAQVADLLDRTVAKSGE